jgi:hypothetical protein
VTITIRAMTGTNLFEFEAKTSAGVREAYTMGTWPVVVAAMRAYRFTVTYDGTIEADDPDTARRWAIEDVEHGQHTPSGVEVEPYRKDANANGD